MGGMRVPHSLHVAAGWISKKVLSLLLLCALLGPEEHSEDTIGIWAKFQPLRPPACSLARLAVTMAMSRPGRGQVGLAVA